MSPDEARAASVADRLRFAVSMFRWNWSSSASASRSLIAARVWLGSSDGRFRRRVVDTCSWAFETRSMFAWSCRIESSVSIWLVIRMAVSSSAADQAGAVDELSSISSTAVITRAAAW